MAVICFYLILFKLDNICYWANTCGKKTNNKACSYKLMAHDILILIP